MKLTPVLIALVAIIMMAIVAGCGGGGTNITNTATGGTNPTTSPIIDPMMGGTVVTDNLTAVMTWAQVQALPANAICQARFNRGPVVAVPVQLLASYVDNGEKLITFQLPKTAYAVSGDSGVQISVNGVVIGGLCYGFSDDSNQFVAKFIGDIIAVGSRNVTNYRSSGTIQGRAFKAIGLANYKLAKSDYLKKTSTRSNQPIIAGMNVMVTESYGAYITGASGTITYIDASGAIWAFGHPYNHNGGNCAKPVFLCRFCNVILGSDAFKQVEPIINTDAAGKIVPFGIMTDDRYAGIKIQQGGQANVIDCQTVMPDKSMAESWVSGDIDHNFEVTNISDALTFPVDQKFDQMSQGTAVADVTFVGQNPTVTGIRASSNFDIISELGNQIHNAAPDGTINSAKLELSVLNDQYVPEPPTN